MTKPRPMLPHDFVLTKERAILAFECGVPEDEIEQQFEQFCRYHRMERRADWDLTWHYWCMCAGDTYESRIRYCLPEHVR